MNERIRELMEQAGIGITGEFLDGEVLYEGTVIQMGKFAELIVQDCLKQIYYNTLMSHPEHNWSEKEIGFNEGVDAAYNKVKKHFGVEE